MDITDDIQYIDYDDPEYKRSLDKNILRACQVLVKILFMPDYSVLPEGKVADPVVLARLKQRITLAFANIWKCHTKEMDYALWELFGDSPLPHSENSKEEDRAKFQELCRLFGWDKDDVNSDKGAKLNL